MYEYIYRYICIYKYKNLNHFHVKFQHVFFKKIYKLFSYIYTVFMDFKYTVYLMRNQCNLL